MAAGAVGAASVLVLAAGAASALASGASLRPRGGDAALSCADRGAARPNAPRSASAISIFFNLKAPSRAHPRRSRRCELRTTCNRSNTKILPSPICRSSRSSRWPRSRGRRDPPHRRLELHFWQEVDDVFGAAIKSRMAFLADEALDLGDGDALHADRGERFADFVELERLDDRGNQFHDAFPDMKMSLGGATRDVAPSECLLHEHGAGRLADVAAVPAYASPLRRVPGSETR